MGNILQVPEALTNLFYNLFKNKEARILLVGLDSAGKTTILYRLKLNESVSTIPTIGFNVETVQFRNVNFTMWDIGGQDKFRVFWKHYFPNTNAVIFVVDSSDVDRISEARKELQRMMTDEHLKDAVVLTLANKQDLPNAMCAAEMTEQLGLHTLKSNKWFIQPCCATSGEGLSEGLTWLSSQL